MTGEIAKRAIEEKQAFFDALAYSVWEHPETAFNEVHAMNATADAAEALGFTVERQAYGMPTCVTARWGSGHPVIGFLGELDALPELSQIVSTQKQEAVPGGDGHGCGHNLLCTATLAGAYGFKEELKARGLSGTVVWYGCPAEEVLTGKGFMARAGAFRELDLAFSWHGSGVNNVPCGTDTGMYSVKFRFKGLASHAGAAPDRGRSALDAVELMNVGANYLREHIPADVRMHYIVTDGGKAPNTVPDNAGSWYYIRARSLDTVQAVYERLVRVAEGAARMTDTELEVEFMGGCHETLPNMVVAELLHQALKDSEPPVWTQEELDFADALNRQSPSYDEMMAAGRLDSPIALGVLPLRGFNGYGSTDVAEVMHIVPCAEVNTATNNRCANGHSWQITACAGCSIGFKGMLYGARALSLAALRAAEDGTIVQKAQEEFREATGGRPYVCPIPDSIPVPRPKQKKEENHE